MQSRSEKKSQREGTPRKNKNPTNTNESYGTQDSGLGRGFLDERELMMEEEGLFTRHQMAALSGLNNDMLELRARLQKAEVEKEALKCQLRDALEERERANRRLEAIGAAHESRITEMHCVIVELNKKLKQQQESAIIEESEGSVSELSFQEGSIYNSDVEGGAELEAGSEKDVDEYEDLFQTDEKGHNTLHVAISNKSTSPCSLPPGAISTQMQALHEEILHLRAQVALLQSQLAARDVELGIQDATNVDEELEEDEKSNYTSDDLCETADILDVMDERRGSGVDIACPARLTNKRRPCPSYANVDSANASVPKMAERVKLRRAVEEQSKHITGTEPTTSGNFSGDLGDQELLQPDIVASARLQELQRLQKKMEHLKVQNNVLTLTLAESKEHSDHLFLLCGKYESNAVALQQALNVTDRAIEAYDVMLALLESKLAILEKQPGAEDNRNAAEAVARHLLNRLSKESDHQHENSSGPWKEIVLLDSDENLKPWTDVEDASLRKHVSKLKGQRFTVANTVVTLEAPFSTKDDVQSPGGANSRGRSRSESRRMDLETAVLMQELLGMREDISEYKYRAEAAEREKMFAQKRLGTLQEALMHLQSQLADSEALLAMATKDRSSFSEAEYAENIERELVESLARESRLKARLQGLAGSLEAAAKNSGQIGREQDKVPMQNINELRQTNIGIDQSLERCKKKYQAKMLKLQQQLLSLSLSNNVNNNGTTTGTSINTTKKKSDEEVPETTL